MVVLCAIPLFCLFFLPVRAEGIFVPAPSRIDIAYDDIRGVLFVSNGGELLRYQIASRTFLPPLVLGGNLSGLDVSPDGEVLAVADENFAGGENWIYLVSLADLTYQKISFPQQIQGGEAGTYSVAYGSDGSILITSQFQGEGNVPLRRLVPSTGSVTTLASIPLNSMLRASADYSLIAIAEAESSDGPFGRYRVSDGNLLLESGANGTSAFNYEIAVRPDGQQYSIPTYLGTVITDGSLVKLPTVIGVYAGGQPVGVAYNPVQNLVYFPWAESTSVYIYDSTTLAPVGTYDFESQFGNNGDLAYVNGRIKTSKDGSLLFATVAGGVRYVTVDAVAPSGLQATENNGSVTLNWTASPNGTSYQVYEGFSPGGESAVPVKSGITATTATIRGLVNGTTYYFTVAAATPVGESTPTTEVSATPIGPPAKVTGLDASVAESAAVLTWNAVPGAASYTVFVRSSQGPETSVPGVIGTTYTTALERGVRYFFQVAAVNTYGIGRKSAPLCVKFDSKVPLESLEMRPGVEVSGLECR